MTETMTTITRKVLTCVVLGLSCVVALECPTDEELSPCTCADFGGLYITCKSLKTSQQLETAMQSLKYTPVYEIWIRDSNVKDIPNDVFENIYIESLFLRKSALHPKSLDKPILQGLENFLSSVTVDKSYPSKEEPMPAFAFGHLIALRDITIKQNYLSVLDNGMFKGGPPGLTHLELSGNHIETIGDQAFADLSALVSLTVSMNRKLVSLKRSMLPKTAGPLQSLTFNRNGIETLPDDIFSGMPSLLELSFYDNKFTTISEDVFSTIYSKLDTLNMNGNPLVCDKKIEWLYEDEETVWFKLYGTCSAPENLKDLDLHLLELDDLK